MAHPDVLIVDDDDATRDGLSPLLSNAGITCDTANDGQEAMEKIDAHEISNRSLNLRGTPRLRVCTYLPFEIRLSTPA